jgi:DNA-binding response OmpR family regulator
MARILFVEHDRTQIEETRDWACADGHFFEFAATGEDALPLVTNLSFDIIIASVQSPGMRGSEFCRIYQELGGQAKVILLFEPRLPVSDQEIRISGAHELITKPLDVAILSNRIGKLLGIEEEIFSSELKVGSVSLDPAMRMMSIDNRKYALTSKECAILEFFMRNPNRIFGSKHLLDAVWQSDSELSTQTVRSWIRLLRQKLSAAGRKDFIRTVPGAGYMVEYRP